MLSRPLQSLKSTILASIHKVSAAGNVSRALELETREISKPKLEIYSPPASYSQIPSFNIHPNCSRPTAAFTGALRSKLAPTHSYNSAMFQIQLRHLSTTTELDNWETNYELYKGKCPKELTHVVYCIIDLINKIIYIGLTTRELQIRMKEHRRDGKLTKGSVVAVVGCHSKDDLRAEENCIIKMCCFLDIPLSNVQLVRDQETASHYLKDYPLNSSQMSYVQGEPAKPLFFETTGDRFRRSVEAKPDKEFVIFRDQNIRKTFSQVYEESRRLAAGMLSLGLQKGDRVGVWGQNYYEWILCFNACAMAGLIQVNINPAYQAEELRYALQKVGVKALFTPKEFKHSKFIETLSKLVPSIPNGKPGCGLVDSKELPELKHLIVFGEEKPINGLWCFSDIATGSGSIDSKILDGIENTILPDDPVNIQYTSGTTGSLKAATLTHHNILNNAYQIGCRSKWHEKDQIACIPNHLYHCFGCVIGVLNALCHTQTCVFPAVNYDVPKILKAIQEEKCTYVFGMPTMFIDILSHKQFKEYDMSSVYGGYLAGAPCPPALCQSLQRHMNMDELYILYGSTELSPIVTLNHSEGSAH